MRPRCQLNVMTDISDFPANGNVAHVNVTSVDLLIQGATRPQANVSAR